MTNVGGVQGPIGMPKFEANGIKTAIDNYISSENNLDEKVKEKALETILNTLESLGIHKNKPLAQKTIEIVLERLEHSKKESSAEAIALLGSALDAVIPDIITQKMRDNFGAVLKWRGGDISPAKNLAEQIFSKKVLSKEAKIAQKERVSSLGAAIMGKLVSAKQAIAKATTRRSTKVEKSSEEEGGTPETKVKKSTRAMSKIARRLSLGGVKGEQKSVVVEQKWASKEAPKTPADLVMKFNCLFLTTKKEKQELLKTELEANSPLRKALSENPRLLEAALSTTTRAIEATGKSPSSLQRTILKNLLDISDNNRQLKIEQSILQRAWNAYSAFQ